MKSLLSILLLLLMAMPALGGGTAPDSAVRQAVETYIKVELDLGDPDKRKQIIRFSPKREAEILEKEPGEWTYSAFGSFDRIVVSSCLIEEIRVKQSQATATVNCHRLARSEGRGDSGTNHWRLVPEGPHNETVSLTLVFAGNQWWVFDPPAPRVSKDGMIRYYASQLRWYDDQRKLAGTLPRHQQEAYDRKSATYRLLMQLENSSN